MSYPGDPGMQGPVGGDYFTMPESSHGEWTEAHVRFQNLCLKIMGILNSDDRFGNSVTITKDKIKAEVIDKL